MLTVEMHLKIDYRLTSRRIKRDEQRSMAQ